MSAPLYILDTNVWLDAIANLGEDGSAFTDYDRGTQRKLNTKVSGATRQLRGQIIYAMTEGVILVPGEVLEELKSKQTSDKLTPDHKRKLGILVDILKGVAMPKNQLSDDEIKDQDALIVSACSAASRPTSQSFPPYAHELGKKIQATDGYSIQGMPGHNTDAAVPLTEAQQKTLDSAVATNDEYTRMLAKLDRRKPKPARLKELENIQVQAADIRAAHTKKVWTDYAILATAKKFDAIVISEDVDLEHIAGWFEDKHATVIPVQSVTGQRCAGHAITWQDFEKKVTQGRAP